jgi:hypothetical protein
MQRHATFRQGDRAEYLAQYILSAFAIAVPVPRQEDVGVDFHCSLLVRDGHNLRPTLPFNIQIKKSGEDVLKNGVRFGGLTPAGDWRRHEIEQLCQTDVPFLIGLVNLETQTLDIFSTITRYFVLANWQGTGPPREIALIPYEPKGEGHLNAGVQEDLEAKPGIPQKLWTLPLGQPIVSIPIDDSENVEKCEIIKIILAPFISMDQENWVRFKIGLGYFNWPLIMRPGQLLREVGIGFSCQGFESPSVQKQLKVLTLITSSLLRSYHSSGMKKEILPWEAVAAQLPFGNEPEFVGKWVKDAITFAHT